MIRRSAGRRVLDADDAGVLHAHFDGEIGVGLRHRLGGEERQIGVIGVVADHVHVQHQFDVHAIGEGAVGKHGTPYQPDFLGIKRDEDDGLVRRDAGQRPGNFHYRHRARAVVVRARREDHGIGLLVKRIVVRTDYNHTVRFGGSGLRANHIVGIPPRVIEGVGNHIRVTKREKLLPDVLLRHVVFGGVNVPGLQVHQVGVVRDDRVERHARGNRVEPRIGERGCQRLRHRIAVDERNRRPGDPHRSVGQILRGGDRRRLRLPHQRIAKLIDPVGRQFQHADIGFGLDR